MAAAHTDPLSDLDNATLERMTLLEPHIARGLAKQLVIESEFVASGVEIEYVLGEYPDTPEGGLMKNIRAVIAEYERLKITERMERGRRRRPVTSS